MDADRTHSHPPSSRLRWRGAILGLVVSSAFLGAFLAGLRMDELRQVPTQVVPGFVLLSAAVLFLEFPLRALRWTVLLTPIQRDMRGGQGGSPLSVGRLFSVTTIGFMANNLLPARAGELVRPYLAARDAGLPFESVLVTCVLERGFDVLGLGIVAAVTLLLLPGSGAAGMDSALLAELTRWATALGVAALLGLTVLCVVAVKGEVFRPLVERVASVLPGPLSRFALRLYDGVLEGLASLEVGWRPAAAVGLTVTIWFNGALAIWILMHAFQLGLPFAAACFLSLTIALAVVLPQAPGFLGVFQVATQATLMAWGVAVAAAQGFAIAFWLVSFLPVSLAGLMALWARGLSLRRLAGSSQEVGAGGPEVGAGAPESASPPVTARPPMRLGRMPEPERQSA